MFTGGGRGKDLGVPPAGNGRDPVLAVITNSTYDGLCYDATRVEELLGKSRPDPVQTRHGSVRRFNPLYRDRYAMRTKADPPDGPTIFATQSTHKLLAALSQASMIHVRNGRSPVEHGQFNEAFMMYTSTSPLYPIIASLDVSSKMMDGPSGTILTTECIEEAYPFRRIMARIGRELGKGKGNKDWWFGMWSRTPYSIRGPGKTVAFADAHHDLLRDEPSPWVLHPDDAWHGFSGLKDGYLRGSRQSAGTDPGCSDQRLPQRMGDTAAIVVKFLETRGIISEKSGDYTILFLFSLGITKGKWGTLVSELFEFKRHYDENSPLGEIFPDLVGKYPGRYGTMTIQDLVTEMHAFMRENRQGMLLEEAFSLLPEPFVTIAGAYAHLVKGRVEQVPVSGMGGRIVATGIVPYPPGIPLLMPGERAGDTKGPVLRYLLALQDFDARFPGIFP